MMSNKVVLFGCASYDSFTGGTGSGEVYSKYRVSICKGVKNAGYRVDDVVEKTYNTHIEKDKKIFHGLRKLLARFVQHLNSR